jgi:hypothetical protein
VGKLFGGSHVVALLEVDGVDVVELHEPLDLDGLGGLGPQLLDLLALELHHATWLHLERLDHLITRQRSFRQGP